MPAAVLLAFLVVPLIALLTRGVGGGELLASLRSSLVAQALALSLATSSMSAAMVAAFGIPLAYVLARSEFRLRPLVDALVDMPMVLPPVVAGVGLLMAFGRTGLVGQILEVYGIRVGFSTVAVVMAQTFVATPFLVRAARAGFAAVDVRLEDASRTLGVSPAGTFLKVTLPLAAPSLFAGLTMAWARAMGEFGATIMFAGNLPGRTRTMPLAILTAMEEDIDAAVALSVLLLAVSFAVLVIFRVAGRRGVPLDAAG